MLRKVIASVPLARKGYASVQFLLKVFKRQFLGEGQIWKLQPAGKSVGSILLVAPGEMALPVKGWGAVELIVQRQAKYFADAGFTVQVLNSWRWSDWVKAWRGQHDFAINHYDVFSKLCLMWARLRRIPLVATTHYAYAEQAALWDPGFKSQVKSMLAADGFVALNPKIQSLFHQANPKANIRCIPNGVEVLDFRIQDQTEGFVCLGKVEPRKRQYELAVKLGETFDITFIGDVVDPRVHTLPKAIQDKFIGGWSRAQVLDGLAKFKGLVLLSEAEADALVLYEAQAAGLHVFASDNALGSQNRELPWVHEIELNQRNLAEVLTDSISSSKVTQSIIHDYSVAHYTSETSSQAWLDYGLEFSRANARSE